MGMRDASAAAVNTALVVLMLSGCGKQSETGKASGVSEQRLLAAQSEPQSWLVNGGSYYGTYFSALKQINQQTIGELGPAWTFEFDTMRGQESEPIIADGVMYVTTVGSKVYALDAATGKQLWFYDPGVTGNAMANACCDAVNRGAAVYNGRVFIATLDGALVALDARTGKVDWRVQTAPQDKPYTITGAPRVARGKVIIGNGGADFNVRGFVSAYDAKSGRLAWRFYTVPGDPAKHDRAASDDILEKVARPTWFGDKYWRYGGGGTAWNEIKYDPDFNQILIGTGNGSPWPRTIRSEGKGDNLFLASIIAVDPDTGTYKWHYQLNPGESWDFSAAMPIILTDFKINGRMHKILMQAPKNGFFYMIDRANGKLLSAKPFVKGITWASHIDLKSGRPVEAKNAHYENGPFDLSPSPAGAHNWHPMSYNPQTGIVYIPARETSTRMDLQRPYRPEDHVVNSGATQKHGGTFPFLLAYDPATGKELWRDNGAGSGVLSTAGGLVFRSRGTIVADLVAYDAVSGKPLWSHAMPQAASAAPVTYEIGGAQYLAVTTGAGGPALLYGGKVAFAREPGRMIVFKLGGKAKLPADPGAAAPFNPASKTWPPSQIAEGGALFGRYCSRCHGRAAESTNIVPDLRRSAALADRDAWQSIVHDGALEASGMIGWKFAMTARQIESIRGYVSVQAGKAKAAGDPPPTRARQATMPVPTADQ